MRFKIERKTWNSFLVHVEDGSLKSVAFGKGNPSSADEGLLISSFCKVLEPYGLTWDGTFCGPIGTEEWG